MCRSSTASASQETARTAASSKAPTSNGAALAHACSIANEHASPAVVGQQLVMALAGIHNGLQLQTAQHLVMDEVIQVKLVGDVGGLHCCQGGCFHHRVRVGCTHMQLGRHIVLRVGSVC